MSSKPGIPEVRRRMDGNTAMGMDGTTPRARHNGHYRVIVPVLGC
jgi:hypothetical protein